MKMLKISVVKTWLCVTGVAVVSAYCICTHRPDTPAERKRAEKVAERISKHGTIQEYKSKNRHSSAIKKTTTAKVVVEDVKVPVYVPNPIFSPFTNALAQLSWKIAEMAKDGDVDLDADTPAGTLGLKKFRIGDGMDVEVKVNWKKERTTEGCDANIDISFTNKDLGDENSYQRHELGKATDEARENTLNETGINYFSVKPRVDQDAVAKKVVY